MLMLLFGQFCAFGSKEQLADGNRAFGEIPFVQSATLIAGLRPAFPAAARRNEICGLVKTALLISPHGKVLEARIIHSRPPSLFDQAVLDVIPSLRFQPHVVLERTVQYQTVWEVKFFIHDGEHFACEP